MKGPVAFALALITACRSSPAPPAEPILAAPAVACSAAPSGSGSWNHRIGSRATAVLGSARHGTSDVLTTPGRAVTLRARFSYGKVLKDLEDETVTAWLADAACVWQSVGQALTDRDGAAQFELPGALVAKAGTYNLEFVVAGDDSRASGTVWVVPAGQRVVVLDVDGTLTTGDDEIVEQLLLGAVAEARPGGAQVAAKYAAAGILPVYLTGRPMMLDALTRDWLKAAGFPPGPVLLTLGYRLGLFDVERFKREAMRRIRDELGWTSVAAYGNASTDICAYAEAGQPPNTTYIVGSNAGESCRGGTPTVAVRDYAEHLGGLRF